MPHETVSIGTTGTSWITRHHPGYELLVEDQERQRASYIASRAILVPFLVPHRFEGSEQGVKPEALNRSNLGYGIGLNKSYLQEILGHVRKATARYTWGPMSPQDEAAITVAPTDPEAKAMWDDVTQDGTSWRNLYLRIVLEWILSSPGGVVVIDTPRRADEETPPTIAEAKDQGLRPYQRFVRSSEVIDLSWGRTGYEWVKLLEKEDARTPKDEGDPAARIYVLYELLDNGETEISRWNTDGEQIGDAVQLGSLVDQQGQPTLPIVRAIYGEHELLPDWGLGLIFDLADVVIDLFNTLSEAREGFRDAAFGVMAYKGNNGTKVQKLLEDGSRFIDLGDEEEADLKRVAGNTEEVTSGLSLIEFGLRAWAWAARRKAADAMTRSTGGPRSGTSLESEFQLDLVPLLVEVAGTLDQIESSAMFIVGQMQGHEPKSLSDAKVGVERDKEFRVEEEAGRIARIIQSFRASGIRLPPELQAKAGVKWAESLDFIDLDMEIETVNAQGEAATLTLREILEEKFLSLAELAAEAERNLAAFGAPGVLGDFPEE